MTARGRGGHTDACPALLWTPTPDAQPLRKVPLRPGHVLSGTSDTKTGKEEEACKQGGQVATELEARERLDQTESKLEEALAPSTPFLESNPAFRKRGPGTMWALGFPVGAGVRSSSRQGTPGNAAAPEPQQRALATWGHGVTDGSRPGSDAQPCADGRQGSRRLWLTG